MKYQQVYGENIKIMNHRMKSKKKTLEKKELNL